jgi:hypothetical protein
MLIILSEKKIERPQPVFPLFKKCPWGFFLLGESR